MQYYLLELCYSSRSRCVRYELMDYHTTTEFDELRQFQGEIFEYSIDYSYLWRSFSERQPSLPGENAWAVVRSQLGIA